MKIVQEPLSLVITSTIQPLFAVPCDTRVSPYWVFMRLITSSRGAHACCAWAGKENATARVALVKKGGGFSSLKFLYQLTDKSGLAKVWEMFHHCLVRCFWRNSGARFMHRQMRKQNHVVRIAVQRKPHRG